MSEKKLFNCKLLVTATVCVDVLIKKKKNLEQKYENQAK